MGTPVPLRSREMGCKGADPQIHKRKLTKEEIARYHSPQKHGRSYDEQVYGRSEEMKKKLDPPSKERLGEMCKKYVNHNRACNGIANELQVSRSTVERWIYDYQLDGTWKKHQQVKPEVLDAPATTSTETAQAGNHESSCVAPETYMRAFDEVLEEATEEKSNTELVIEAIREAAPIQFEHKPDVEVQKLGVEDCTQEQAADEFILINKVYKFGTFGVDVQYDLNQVVICDPDNDGELVIPFGKLARIAGNLQKISTELTEREVM